MDAKTEIKKYFSTHTKFVGGCQVVTCKDAQIGPGKLYALVGVRNIKRIMYLYHDRSIPYRIGNTCGNARCVLLEHLYDIHSKPSKPKPIYEESYHEIPKKSKAIITVHKSIFWHMDKMGMIDWSKNPPQLKHRGVNIAPR